MGSWSIALISGVGLVRVLAVEGGEGGLEAELLL